MNQRGTRFSEDIENINELKPHKVYDSINDYYYYY
jgi:hypothetical protein